MPVHASTNFTKLVVDSLARPSVVKRRRPNRDARSSNERILRKVAPPASPVACERPNEAQAITPVQACDPAVFEDLYRLHSRRVYALCLRMVKDTSEAEDLTQETFLLLFRKLHTFRGESAFSTWLHRLTVNLVLMRFRKKSPPFVSIEEPSVPDDEMNLPGKLKLGVRDLLLEGVIDRITLERCIEQLPAGFRNVFVLHDVRGYRHREIANLLGYSVGASKSQLHKARKRLRESLQGLRRKNAREQRPAAVSGVSTESAFAGEA